jgi:hypothetical protein
MSGSTQNMYKYDEYKHIKYSNKNKKRMVMRIYGQK